MMKRYASSPLQPIACSHCASQPPARAPAAVANEPARLYQPKILVRLLSGTSWESAACSMDKKGPISPPLGLTMPMIAARVIHTGSLVRRKTKPARIIRAAPKQQHVLAAKPVSHHGHPEGNQDITGQRSGENGPNAGCTQTGGGEIERQNNRDEPVGEQPDCSGGKE